MLCDTGFNWLSPVPDTLLSVVSIADLLLFSVVSVVIVLSFSLSDAVSISSRIVFPSVITCFGNPSAPPVIIIYGVTCWTEGSSIYIGNVSSCLSSNFIVVSFSVRITALPPLTVTLIFFSSKLLASVFCTDTSTPSCAASLLHLNFAFNITPVSVVSAALAYEKATLSDNWSFTMAFFIISPVSALINSTLLLS